MSWRNYKNIYVNGCSFTAGGGLYPGQFSNVVDEYHNQFGIKKWKSEREITYPQKIANHFNCNLVDDSQCGSGAPRLVRKTWEYIRKVGLDEAKKTIFLLQINNPINRIDFYSRRINDYIIVNVEYNDDLSFKYINVVDSHSTTESIYTSQFFSNDTKDILFYLKNFHDPLKYNDKIYNELLGLFSFFEFHGIEYFFGFDYSGGDINLNENRRVNVFGFETIEHMSNSTKSSIYNEIGKDYDRHPGYFAHQKWADGYINFIEEKMKPTLWVFGDSFSSKSDPQIDPSSYLYTEDFRMKYFNFKGYFPPSYPEIVAKEFDLNLVNLATPSFSNDNIFHSFIDVADKIKPNDLLFFGWTYVTRFNIANERNELSNVNIRRDDDNSIEGGVSMKAKNEILYNRDVHTIWVKLLNNYLKIINQCNKENLIFHFYFPGSKKHFDEYEKEFFDQLSFSKNMYQRIFEDTNDSFKDGHYSEKGHRDFANDIIKKIKLIWKHK